MQPSSGFQSSLIGTIGTTVINAYPTYLKRIVVGGTYVGTIQLDDSSSSTGTSATTQIITVPIPGLNLLRSIDLDVQCKSGLLCQATGTPVVTLVWN